MTDKPPLRILHLSDLHLGERRRWDADPVLRGLGDAIRELADRGLGPDVVALTGDLADRGTPEDYTEVSRWMDRWLLPSLPSSFAVTRLFLIPGNHDVNRSAVKTAAQSLQSELIKRADQEEIAAVLADPEEREVLLRRHADYLQFVKRIRRLEGDHDVPWWTKALDWHGVNIHFAGLCSSWMSSSDQDHGKLLVSRWQLHQVLAGVDQAAFAVSLIHHPWSYLADFDGTEVVAAVRRQCHLVLRGHLHEQRSQIVSDPDDVCLELAAGSAYSGSRFPNAFQLIEIFPLDMQVRVHYLIWQNGRWIPDRNAYRATADGVAFFDLGRSVLFEAGVASTSTTDPHPFLTEYRRRQADLYARWDMGSAGVVATSGAGRHRVIALDDIYVPLRLARNYDALKTHQGATLDPKQLLGRQKQLVIRGGPGSGKTTWVRWTFRRLLSSDGSIPILLTLRHVARSWQRLEAIGEARSLEACLIDFISEHGLGGYQQQFLQVLKHPPTGLRPVLLVDGWDELGELGEELRAKLAGFVRTHPQVLVVVTSRPYGHSMPSDSEGFEVQDIQPLSDVEIRQLAGVILEHRYGSDRQPVAQSLEDFTNALDRSEEAIVLARTPLLLVMMLLLSLSRPLPDKRHQLYQACIENLLTALPDRKASEGALLLHEQYRPEDSHERFGAAAALAFRYVDSGWSTAGLEWQRMADLLPSEWSQSKRFGFLSWLSGPAGLLAENTDGEISFRHRSLLEYLTAWHLDTAFKSDEERIAYFRYAMGMEVTWEYLRLWGAMIQERNDAQLARLLRGLFSDLSNGFWLAGCMLADGLGSEGVFTEWTHRLVGALDETWHRQVEQCAEAWVRSRQNERRQAISNALQSSLEARNWLGWLRYKQWHKTTKLTWPLASPRPGSNAEAVVAALNGQLTTARQLAVGRVLCAADPLWPNTPPELVLLRTWPARRKLVGHRLQALASLGARREQLAGIAPSLLVVPKWSEPASRFVRAVARLMKERAVGPYAAVDFARYIVRDLAPEVVRSFAREIDNPDVRSFVSHWHPMLLQYFDYPYNTLPPHFTTLRCLDRPYTEYLAGCTDRNLNLPTQLDLGICYYNDARSRISNGIADTFHATWGHRRPSANRHHDLDRFFLTDVAPSIARYFAPPISLVHSSSEDDIRLRTHYGQLELMFFGRLFTCASLACEEEPKGGNPIRRLSFLAGRIAVGRDPDPEAFESALQEYPDDGDMLWPALARHIARCSTSDDRSLLEDLARHPEKREPPVSWGLRYLVRGDISMDDGSELTLDDLCDELRVPALPYLEEMPDKLELD